MQVPRSYSRPRNPDPKPEPLEHAWLPGMLELSRDTLTRRRTCTDIQLMMMMMMTFIIQLDLTLKPQP